VAIDRRFLLASYGKPESSPINRSAFMETTQTSVVITGASSGFGECAAALFARTGHRVWGTMRDTQGRNAAKKTALEALSSDITILEMDVTDDVSVASAFE